MDRLLTDEERTGVIMNMPESLGVCSTDREEEDAKLKAQDAKTAKYIMYIMKLYEDMGCVPEEDNCWYRFWQALKKELGVEDD